jgi:hypothetical protein
VAAHVASHFAQQSKLWCCEGFSTTSRLGTIVASAVIAATAAGGKSPDLILAATVATLLDFWLAHVYADYLHHGLRHGSADLKVLAFIMGQELSMVAAPAVSILFLLLGALGLLGEGLAVRLALRSGVVQLGRPGGLQAVAGG